MDEKATKLSYGEVKKSVDTINNECLQKMRSIFDNFNTKMNVLGGQDVFVGDASESFQARYNRLKTKFTVFEGLVKEFAREFEFAASSTQQAEKEMANEAQNLNDGN